VPFVVPPLTAELAEGILEDAEKSIGLRGLSSFRERSLELA
jgi:hypothetical protein